MQEEDRDAIVPWAVQASQPHPDEVGGLLNVHPNTGLSSAEVEARQAKYGLNSLGHDINSSSSSDDTNTIVVIAKNLGESLNDPLILLLLASAVVSLLFNHVEDAVSITMSILIVISVSSIQEYKSNLALDSLKSLVPHTATVLRNNKVQYNINASQVVPGDVLLLKTGDRVPADSRLISSVQLATDESSLTGETEPVAKCSTSVSHNLVYMGTSVVAGNGRAIVYGTGRETEFGRVFDAMESVEDRKTPLQHRMDALGKQLSVMSIAVIALIVFVEVVFQGRNVLSSFQIATSLAVAAIPEGLPIVVTLTLALGVLKMSKRGVILKKLHAVEALGSVRVLCVDKTGTLTTNQMKVVSMYVPKEGRIVTAPINKSEFASTLVKTGVLCNNATLDNNNEVEVGASATEAALLVLGSVFDIYSDMNHSAERTDEVPFSSDTKWMGVQYDHHTWYVKGSIEAVLSKCNTTENIINKDLMSQMIDSGQRVLALAHGPSLSSLEIDGFVGIADPPREFIDSTISELQSTYNVRTVMITGDSCETAQSIASAVGITCDNSVSGSELDELSLDTLQEVVRHTNVFYRTCPRHKLDIVQAFQANEFVTAMTGDGVNDGPALKAADIGISMGTSSDVSKAASDMILVNDDLESIVVAMTEGLVIERNILIFLRFQLTISVAALGLVAASTLLSLPNPLNAMQILFINIIMDGPTALSLGVEPKGGGDIKSSKSNSNNIVSKELVVKVVTNAVVILSGTLYVFYSELEKVQEGEFVITKRDRTISFATFVTYSLLTAYVCRVPSSQSVLTFRSVNLPFNIAVGASLLSQLLVIYVPMFQRVFQTEGLYLKDMLSIICIASTTVIVDEIVKVFPHIMKTKIRRKRHKKTHDNDSDDETLLSVV